MVKLADVAKSQRGEYWVTSRYYEFIQNQRNIEAERDALQTIMTRPPRVRINTFSASGAGRCLRERQLAFMGIKRMPNDEKSANIFANGDYVHLRYQVAGLVGGWLEQAEVPAFLPEYQLSGTLDGMLINGHGLEVKSINDRGFTEIATFGPKHDHLFQTHSYMLAKQLDTFHIVYENKNTNQVKEFLIHRDEKLIDQIVRELEELNSATAAGVLLPMQPNCVLQTGSQYSWCQYRKSCPSAKFASAAQRKSPIRVVSSTPSA